MSRLTDKEWVELTRRTIELHNQGQLRLGQSYMIALHEINKQIYEDITATKYDCFYSDNLIDKFVEFLNDPSIEPKKQA